MKAIYGLRESPKAWGDERDAALRQLSFYSWGMPHKFRQLMTDPSVWIIEPNPIEFVKPRVNSS